MGVTLTSNQVVNVQLAPLFANLVGAWSGTETSVGLGTSTVCNDTWLINSQTGGAFAGTFQLSGNGCSEAGSFQGTISTTNAITDIHTTSVTVGSGVVCHDSNATTSGLLSGRTITIQSSFTRSCTSPINLTFPESQTLSMTKQ
jgi:hypothetical protein